MKEVTINNNNKDRLFNFIFGYPENKKWTLSLYNAVNGSAHTDENAIEFNTIKDVLYMRMRNDTSFIIYDIVSLYEHQSTFNPNMPLRQLQYLGNLYESYVKKNKLNKYGSKLIMLPVPKLVVFYNGETEKADEIILKLSDSFAEAHRQESDVEVRVRMLNINYGHNAQLLGSCKPLYEYSWFIKRIQDNMSKADKPDIEEATSLAIDEMPDDFIIKDFLEIHRAEVKGMLLTEYDEAETLELFKKEARDEGKAEGKEEGKEEINCR
ncbi:MAG: hypothetical protein K6E70_10140 [Butyrivibrio sp.]|nr:hypothetical protein [Butyrivibrio sp.]